MNNNRFNMQIEDGLICDFVAIFSRIEFALKASIEYANGNERKVNANWDKFANDIHKDFITINNVDLKKAIDYLFTNPPKKQVLKDDQLQFIENNLTQNKTYQVLVLVRRVRNNLFHGGKYHPNEEERDKNLLIHSLKILEECVKVKNEVYRLYKTV